MSVSASLPPCWLYNTDSQSWEPFQSLTIKLYDDQQVSRFENSNPLSNENITKVITYDYIAYFSRVVPSIILNLNKASNLEPQSETRDQQCLSPNQINCILVLEDLPLRYCPVYHDDQFILIGFQVASLTYEETNHELMKVKDIIYQVHYKLNYSKEALAYQVSKRVQKIIYKTVKYALCNLAELFNIHQSLRSHEKLESLQRMCQDPNFYEYLKYIIHSPSFLNDLTSLAYKTILQIGLYPCCVELNTMDEIGLWLKIKDLVTNSENAPYGANYHASLCMGNYRYSLVFEFGDKEKQGLQISFEGKRKFSFKNRDFQYFRVPVLDFFPMDCWVREISSATFEVLNDYLDQINQVKEKFSHKANVYKEALKHWVYGGPYGEEGLSYKIAVELYERFQPELEESQMFEKITQEICAAELKGYKYLSNNCQTVVNKIMDILDTSLSRHKKELVIGKEGQNEERKQNFLKFGAHFNYKFRFLGPFNLKAQSPFFHIFVDSDTIEMISQIRGTNIHDHIREYKERKHVRKFLRELEKSLDTYKKRYRDGHKKNIKFREADEMLNKIEVDLDNDHGVIACLMNILCNELFQLRREIKIAKYCKLKLEERTRVDNRTIALSLHLPKRRALKGAQKLWQEAAAKLTELYSTKYKLSNLCRELRFYYYNTIRLANMERPEEGAVYYGFLLVKNPQENLRQTIHLDLDLAGRQFDFE